MSRAVREYETNRCEEDKKVRQGVLRQIVQAGKAVMQGNTAEAVAALTGRREQRFQTPQLSASATTIPRECTSSLACEGFLDHDMRI